MELRHLRSFVAVAEELHFGRAAERLHLAQSPLSQQLRRLERELGVRLFDRNRRKVELTEAGRAMLDDARATLLHADRAARATRLAAEGRSGELAIGFLGTAALELLPRVLPHVRSEIPDAELRLVEAPSRELLDAVRGRRLDVAFTRPPSPEPDLEVEPVWSEPLVAAIPGDHPLTAGGSLRLSDLANEPFILFPATPAFHDQLIGACHRAGFSPRIVQEAVAVPTIVGLVAAGVGVSLVPSSIRGLAGRSVTYRSLEDLSARAEIAMVTRQHDRSALLDTFAATIHRALAPISRSGSR